MSEPFLGDPNFDRSVILLTEHNENGSIGFVINKPLELQLDDIVIGFPSLDTAVYHGGPVQQDSLYFIHNKGNLIPGSEQITDDLYWGGDLEPLKEMVELGLITPNDIRFFLGYSGWGVEQLEAEVADKAWLTLESSAVNIFENDALDMWKNVLRSVGGDYSLWANSPADPALN